MSERVFYHLSDYCNLTEEIESIEAEYAVIQVLGSNPGHKLLGYSCTGTERCTESYCPIVKNFKL